MKSIMKVGPHWSLYCDFSVSIEIRNGSFAAIDNILEEQAAR